MGSSYPCTWSLLPLSRLFVKIKMSPLKSSVLLLFSTLRNKIIPLLFVSLVVPSVGMRGVVGCHPGDHSGLPPLLLSLRLSCLMIGLGHFWMRGHLIPQHHEDYSGLNGRRMLPSPSSDADLAPPPLNVLLPLSLPGRIALLWTFFVGSRVHKALFPLCAGLD